MNEKERKLRDQRDKRDKPYEASADQAEGERDRTTTTKVGRTPGQAEGERDPAEYDPDRKPKS